MSQRVCQPETSCSPSIGSIIGGAQTGPAEHRNFIERNVVVDIHTVPVIDGSSEIADIVPQRILFLRCIYFTKRLINPCIGSRREINLHGRKRFQFQTVKPVPVEELIEGRLNQSIAINIALQGLSKLAVHFCPETIRSRQRIEVDVAHQLQPFLSPVYQLIEWLEGLRTCTIHVTNGPLVPVNDIVLQNRVAVVVL